MSFLGLPIAETIAGLVGKVLDRVIPDPLAREQAKERLLEMQQKGELAQLAAETDLAKGQLEIDKTEAANPNWFVAGWRPFIGWTCGAIMAFNYLFSPLITWLSTLAGKPVAIPVLDFSTIAPVLFGMLGLGTMRTLEKFKGVSRE